MFDLNIVFWEDYYGSWSMLIIEPVQAPTRANIFTSIPRNCLLPLAWGYGGPILVWNLQMERKRKQRDDTDRYRVEVDVPFLIQNVAFTNKNQARNVVCDVLMTYIYWKIWDMLSHGDKILIKQLNHLLVFPLGWLIFVYSSSNHQNSDVYIKL